MASFASPPLSPSNGAQNPETPVWDRLLYGEQLKDQQQQMEARSSNVSPSTGRFGAPRGDSTEMSQAERPMSHDYDLSSVYGSRQAPGQDHSRRREQSMLGDFEADSGSLSAAIETLSNRFAAPQHSVPGDASDWAHSFLFDMSGGVPNDQPDPMPHSSTSQSISAMPDLSPIEQGRLDRNLGQDDYLGQNLTEQSVDQAFSQYQQALCGIFESTRAGRLVEASKSLLKISGWLESNARDLGILHDNHSQYDHHLQLWKNFNLCWLAVCQTQKDMTQELVSTGQQPAQTSLLSRDNLEAMGKDLIRLCDQLQAHGLVDYQMGIWEEEILCVLGQCLDLIERIDTPI
ncbi:hypothetical protein N7526_001995 [Penicillium atrosanguineum]|nr:hypothetical protein N7526_001995 [Penicillium atrosanguineum]